MSRLQLLPPLSMVITGSDTWYAASAGTFSQFGRPEAPTTGYLYLRLVDRTDTKITGTEISLVSRSDGSTALTNSANTTYTSALGWKQLAASSTGVYDFAIKVPSASTVLTGELQAAYFAPGSTPIIERAPIRISASDTTIGTINTNVSTVSTNVSTALTRIGSPSVAGQSTDLATLLGYVFRMAGVTPTFTLDGAFTHTTTIIQCSTLANDANWYGANCRIIFNDTSGGPMSTCVRAITSYDTTNKRLTLTTALPVTPVNGDTFVIIPS